MCTPNHLHLPLAEAALAAGKHVICEKPLALDVAGAERLTELAAEPGRCAFVPFVYRYHPMVREARERVRSGRAGAVRLVHGTYLQDWLLRPRTTTGASTPTSAAPRARSPTSGRTGVTSPSSSPATASRAWGAHADGHPGRVRASHRKAFAAGGATGRPARSAPRTRRWCSSRPTTARSGRRSSARSPPAARTGSGWRSTAPRSRSRSTRRSRRACGAAAASPRRSSSATRRPVRAGGAAALAAGRPRAGLGDCFAAFVADAYAAIRDDGPSTACPLFADGLRTAGITDAVLDRAREERWIDVPAHEPMEVAT